jgi:multidrug transporter EmrE-like cation transporter
MPPDAMYCNRAATRLAQGLIRVAFDLKYIPLGVAYAIWSGLGTVG